MRPGTSLGLKVGIVLWAGALGLTLALSAGARQCPRDISRAGSRAYATTIGQESFSTSAVPEAIGASNHQQVTQYAMDFDGDHSLDLATVIEQAVGSYVRYTVQLRLASGTEQSIDVTAPSGGLELEMQDMSGDRVPNDLILRPALARWLPTVLLNDSHDHFAVVISATDSGFLASGQELASRGNEDQGTIALISSGFKAGRPVSDGGLFLPQFQEELHSPTTQTNAKSLRHSSSSGRAPPTHVITA
jgi:hypothetical protein